MTSDIKKFGDRKAIRMAIERASKYLENNNEDINKGHICLETIKNQLKEAMRARNGKSH